MRSTSIVLRRLLPAAALLLVGWVLVGEARSRSEPAPTAGESPSATGPPERPVRAATPARPVAEGAVASPTDRVAESSRSNRQAPRRHSRAIGEPTNGRLIDGVALPVAGPDHVTWH